MFDNLSDLCLLECEQRSPEWYAARLAIPTASGFHRIVRPDGSPSDAALKYRIELVADYIRKEAKAIPVTADMARGIEMEPMARSQYVLHTGHRVIEVGGVFLDKSRTVMASPDGLMPEQRRGLEIKCPQLEKHIQYCMENVLPTRYAMQVHGSIMITGYDGWDFVSYCPEYTPQPLLVIPVERDAALLAKIRKHVLAFCAELDAHKRVVDVASERQSLSSSLPVSVVQETITTPTEFTF